LMLGDLISSTLEPELVACNMDGSVDYWTLTLGYVSPGELISSIFDSEQEDIDWYSVNWDSTVPADTTLSVQVRGSADAGDMGEWSEPMTLPGLLAGVLESTDRYLQYKVNLTNVVFVWDYQEGVDDDDAGLPTAFSLNPAYPNPSVDSAVISFSLPRDCHVNIDIFDVKGRKVRTVVDEDYTAGNYKAGVFGLTSGLYTYRMAAGEFTAVKNLVVK
jgi:hypothetical protein